MKRFWKLIRKAVPVMFGMAALGVIALIASYIYIAPNLPTIEALRDIRLQVPLRVFTRDQKLIAEFGQMRRTPLKFYETPDLMVKAILAAEDDRFFEHPGVDYHGILRAAVNLIKTGQKSQGGSTITMQVARNFFLSREKTYLRKLSEIFLALKIERELSKEEILELYLNKIYLGNRAYGVAAAAQIYYGKSVKQLTPAQMAMIAGLPKAPSRYNPIADPERALVRRNYILGRMRELNFIDDATLQTARAETDNAELHGLTIETEAPYAAEMMREMLVQRYGEDAYTRGFRVTTTLDSRLQEAANTALRKALLDYDRRHGYRGPVSTVDLTTLADQPEWVAVFKNIPRAGGLEPALVLTVDEKDAILANEDEELLHMPWSGLSWARAYVDNNRLGPEIERADSVLHPGDIVYVQKNADHSCSLAQIPQIEGAIVSLNPTDGSIMALSGGFDFYQSKFNRVTQATRQPGSSFKPFIYSAALDKGFTAASIINDAPVVFDDPGLESTWRPENYSGRFFGPTRLRIALIHSRNLVSIRLLRSIGIDYTLDYLARFGFDTADLPKDLSLALGSGAITPLQLAGGYAVFANGGYRVEPYIAEQIDLDDETILKANPAIVCSDCEQQPEQLQPDREPAPSDTTVLDESDLALEEKEPAAPRQLARRVIDDRNCYLMTSMMRDVIQRGTGRGARVLGRHDLAGKTGTTNDQRDAWFAGFNPDVVTITWVGFDKGRSLGNRETGARAALPMWISYMAEALKQRPEKILQRPPGLVSVRIDPETGYRTDAGNPKAVFETFRAEYVPRHYTDTKPAQPATDEKPDAGNGTGDAPEQVF